MAIITPEQDIALVDATLKELGPFKFNQIAQRFQNYAIYSKMLKGRKRVKMYGSGTSIQKNIMFDHTEARVVGEFAQDVLNIANLGSKIRSWWVRQTTNFAIDREQVSVNRAPSRIYDFVKMQRDGMWLGMIQACEDQGWGVPASSSDETVIPGIPYAVATGATDSTASTFTGIGGLNGATTGFATNVFGQSPTTNTRWRNFYKIYTAINDSDLIDSMRDGARLTNFESPIDTTDYNTGGGNAYYTNNTVMNGINRTLRYQNDNLGFDLDPANGKMTFQRIPIQYVAKLDGFSANPIYGINWDFFEVCIMEGWDFSESDEKQLSLRHTVRAQYLDLMWSMICTDRRRQQVFATANF